MANVIFTPPFPVAARRWDPGTDEDWILGPADAYRYSTITVTAHAHEPVYAGKHSVIAVQELRVENRTPGETLIGVRMRNFGNVTLRSYYIMVSTVGP
ncbi:hypothetical protein CBR59_30470 [Bacillus thuringiensis]|uniref:hypothetical protein n=1 Tax=Bacillus thuringiensis TaxID=1428 RepID=UPI000C9DC228|nr:hypothetical protein [Bacillus thuringiensis]PNK22626.1 hypothetical protein CBP87_30760 [Bacillus thuringiensis]PNK45803.1 hypothetical protein CBR59_30470 [Bacillus thuringiensis]HDR8043346.1 hypothetical protein [Bacillus cereus]